MTPHQAQRGASKRSFASAFGPGLVFAGASVGVSHLVQSTRAGTGWGLSLWFVILLALVLKYPPFRFGPLYAAATERSLLEGYRQQGRWTLWLFLLITVSTMFAVAAAVTLVTSALMHDRLLAVGLASPGIAWLNAMLLVACSLLLLVGGYRWLDRVTKLLVPLFTVLTIVAAAMMLPKLGPVLGTFWPTASMWEVAGTIAFLAALIGWMPTAVDLAAWQSLWVLERGRACGRRPAVGDVMLDFNVGYIATGFLAFCFLVLGAGTSLSGATFPSTATAFPAFFINLYRDTVGPWAGGIVAVAALAVMVSTTVAVLDGFPRALAVLLQRLRGPELVSGFQQSPCAGAGSNGRWTQALCMVVLASGAFILLQLLSNAFLTVIDVATIASFLTAPMLAAMNHRAVTSLRMPIEHRPGRWMRLWSWVSIAMLSCFAVFYVVYRIMG
jgi:Mn2+/Fe2+ NRAMP family transporter